MSAQSSQTAVSVCAVVITYHPDTTQLEQLLQSVLPQVSAVVIVDNGSDECTLASLRSVCQQWATISLIELGDNLGIAAAQNRGIVWARERCHSHVLLLDQDSTPAADMLQKLLQAWETLSCADVPVAAVGPRLVDRRTSRSTPFILKTAFHIHEEQEVSRRFNTLEETNDSPKRVLLF